MWKTEGGRNVPISGKKGVHLHSPRLKGGPCDGNTHWNLACQEMMGREDWGQWGVLSTLIDNVGVTEVAWKIHTTLDCISNCLFILYQFLTHSPFPLAIILFKSTTSAGYKFGTASTAARGAVATTKWLPSIVAKSCLMTRGDGGWVCHYRRKRIWGAGTSDVRIIVKIVTRKMLHSMAFMQPCNPS